MPLNIFLISLCLVQTDKIIDGKEDKVRHKMSPNFMTILSPFKTKYRDWPGNSETYLRLDHGM